MRTSELVDLIGTELYYGFNLSCILAESSTKEIEVITSVFNRAKAWRENKNKQAEVNA